MYEVDIYSNNGTIIPNECSSIDEVLKLISESLSVCQLINIINLRKQ